MMRFEDLSDADTYSHVEKGGAYQYMGTIKIKQPDGSWVDGIQYFDTNDADGDDSGMYARERNDFLERFVRVEE